MKLIRTLSVAALALAGVINCLAAEAPRYVFYFIGDGMGHGAVTLAKLFKEKATTDSEPLTMLSLPVASMAFTHSASSPVTDSAAAGTALATGRKTRNGMLGVTPDSVAVVSIAEEMFDNGYGIGLVTSVAPDDATPGAFYAHQPSRGMYYEIGCDAAKSGFDFLAGANLRGLKTKDGKPTDLLQVMADYGVDVVRGMDALANSESKRILLLNTDTIHKNDIGYAIDSIDNVLHLPEMTQACLDHLMKYRPEKFFMMVEGGSIDHAAHANDAATVAVETLDFDKALAIAYRFYEQHPDETLIVVTADHETGGLMLGNDYLYYMVRPELLKHQRKSAVQASEFVKQLLKEDSDMSWDEMKQFLKENFGLFGAIKVDDATEAKLHQMFTDAFVNGKLKDRKTLYDSFNAFSDEVLNQVSRLNGIGWTSPYHTGTPVPVYSVGVGSEKFNRALDNTEIPEAIRDIVLRGIAN